MKNLNLFNEVDLGAQIRLQKKMAWDISKDINWDKKIQIHKYFVPVEEADFGLAHISQEQKIVLSQLLGLIINQTICEMESSLPKLKLLSWEKKLKKYPVNPEMKELGEIFFEEEKKHAQSFRIFEEKFCHENAIDPKDLRKLLPQSINTNFLKIMIWNAERGGAAFWWLVAAVEEVSVNIFKRINQERTSIDPLYFELHKLHAEEEIRHENYAYLMLELDQEIDHHSRNVLLKKTDLLIAETVSIPWMMTELTKIFRVREINSQSDFFKTLTKTLPLFEEKSTLSHLFRFLTSTPYISWLANPKNRKKHLSLVKKNKILSLSAA